MNKGGGSFLVGVSQCLYQNRVLSHFQFAERFYENISYLEQFHDNT